MAQGVSFCHIDASIQLLMPPVYVHMLQKSAVEKHLSQKLHVDLTVKRDSYSLEGIVAH